MKCGPKPTPPVLRILANIEVTEDECWVWQRRIDRYGYGQYVVTVRPRRWTFKAHRVAFELWHGPIPGGHVIDHLCRNRACVNPDHLEAVTQRQNIERGLGFGRSGVTRAEAWDDIRAAS